MTWWPGWESADSAGFWSHFWFWVGIVCLFVVGASEIISHIYVLRKDELMLDKLVSLAAAQKVEALKNKNDQGNAPVAERQKAVPPKILTPEQQQILIAALRPFAGQKVRVHSVVGSDDRLADDFIEVFRAANWQIDPESPSHVVLAKRLFGLQPTVNPVGTDPPAFPVLVDTLAALRLGPDTGFADREIPVGIIDMKIGILGNPTEK
jgi:hypothetical protein